MPSLAVSLRPVWWNRGLNLLMRNQWVHGENPRGSLLSCGVILLFPSHTHRRSRTLNNAEGIIAVAGVLNELCEVGIYGQQFTGRDLRHLRRRSCWMEIKYIKKNRKLVSQNEWRDFFFSSGSHSPAADRIILNVSKLICLVLRPC